PGLVPAHLDVVRVVTDGGHAVAAWGEDAAGHVVAQHGGGQALVADEGGRGQGSERGRGRAGRGGGGGRFGGGGGLDALGGGGGGVRGGRVAQGGGGYVHGRGPRVVVGRRVYDGAQPRRARQDRPPGGPRLRERGGYALAVGIVLRPGYRRAAAAG